VNGDGVILQSGELNALFSKLAVTVEHVHVAQFGPNVVVVGEFLKSCRSGCLVEAATVGLPSVRRKIQWRPYHFGIWHPSFQA
jgi:hypothetical protein